MREAVKPEPVSLEEVAALEVTLGGMERAGMDPKDASGHNPDEAILIGSGGNEGKL